MLIYLIRHGETPGNAKRIVQLPETPLSERGRGQAERLAQRLSLAGVAKILTSDLARARETAECLSRSTGVRPELCAALQERNFGALRGTAYADLSFDLFAPELEPPEGESWSQFYVRTSEAWDAVRGAAKDCGPEENLAVVTHGLVCHAMVSRHLSWDGRDEAGGGDAPLSFGNTSLTVIEGAPPWRIELLGCTEHLDDAYSPDRDTISGI